MTIAVVLLGALAGCRSTDRPAAGEHSDWGAETATSHLPSDVTSKHWPADVRPVAYVEEVREFVMPDQNRGGDDPPEPLPIPELNEQPNGPLTLADLESIALQHNPSLSVAAARVEAAWGRWVQAGLYPNPIIGYHATEIGNLGTAAQQGAFVGQRLITAGKRRLDRSVAYREVQESQFLFDAQQQRVLNDIRVRFYDALVAQQRLELTRKLAHLGDDLVATSERLLAGRLVSENDLLQAEIEADQAHITFDNAHNEHAEAWRRLAAVSGVPTMLMTPLDGELDSDLPNYSWEDCYAMVLSQSPEVAAARERIERACVFLERAHRERIPDVDVSVSVRHHNVTSDDVTNVQVGIPIPIFDANQGNIRKAQADWGAAHDDIRRIELDLQDRLAVAYRRYANARQQVDRYKNRILERARRSLELVTDAYEKGQADYLTLINSQQTFIRANLAYLDALRALRGSLAVIEGQLLSGSLSQR